MTLYDVLSNLKYVIKHHLGLFQANNIVTSAVDLE